MNSDFILAIHSMVFLHHRGETVSSNALADNTCTHSARVRRVMAKLGKAKLVETREGRSAGGYSYQKIKRVTLAEISMALDIHFCECNWRSGDQERDCFISSGMSDYADMLQTELDQKCKVFLNNITIADVEHWLERRKADKK